MVGQQKRKKHHMELTHPYGCTPPFRPLISTKPPWRLSGATAGLGGRQHLAAAPVVFGVPRAAETFIVCSIPTKGCRPCEGRLVAGTDCLGYCNQASVSMKHPPALLLFLLRDSLPPPPFLRRRRVLRHFLRSPIGCFRVFKAGIEQGTKAWIRPPVNGPWWH